MRKNMTSFNQGRLKFELTSMARRMAPFIGSNGSITTANQTGTGDFLNLSQSPEYSCLEVAFQW